MKYSKGFGSFVVRLAIFVVIAISIWITIKVFLTNSPLFNRLFFLPDSFYPYSKARVGNILLLFAVCVILYNKNNLLQIKYFPPQYKESITFSLFSILLLAFHYYTRYIIRNTLAYFSNHIILAVLIKESTLVLFVCSLLIASFGTKVIKHLITKYYLQLLVFLPLSVAYYIITSIFENIWPFFSRTVTIILQFVYSVAGYNATYHFTTTGVVLNINNFSVSIGKPCSGIDSLLLFLVLCTLIFILDFHDMRKILFVLSVITGIFGVFALNILRIFLLLLVGLHISPKLSTGLFHTNIGWILFIMYFFIFWWIASRFVYKKSNTHSDVSSSTPKQKK
ncbi:MAG: archaeosortase/exosortase family protein [Candidatus Woesearchaeota archaeon]